MIALLLVATTLATAQECKPLPFPQAANPALVKPPADKESKGKDNSDRFAAPVDPATVSSILVAIHNLNGGKDNSDRFAVPVDPATVSSILVAIHHLNVEESTPRAEPSRDCASVSVRDGDGPRRRIPSSPTAPSYPREP
jgi:hypothetical protein